HALADTSYPSARAGGERGLDLVERPFVADPGRARLVAELVVHGAHRRIPVLGGGHQLAKAIAGGPCDLGTLERRRDPAVAVRLRDRRQAVLGQPRIRRTAKQAHEADDTLAVEREQRAALEDVRPRRLLLEPALVARHLERGVEG